jgi:hypothetical protein
MAASPERSRRRRRYQRQPPERPLALTPRKLALLQVVAEYGLASLPQLAALSCPSRKSARRHLRDLFDLGLVDVIPVPRVALAEPVGGNHAELLYGSAPNIYSLTSLGLKALQERGLVQAVRLPGQRYGPRNSLFLSHELAVRDVRLWFELSARRHADHQLEIWQDGAAAEIDLKRARPPKAVRPDAWLVYRVGDSVLVGLLEVDRGTERGSRRWQEKLAAYELLFQRGALRALTGYVNARVLIVTLHARRRDGLADFVAEHASPGLAGRFWLADRSTMNTPDVHQMGWRQPGSKILRPMISLDRSTSDAQIEG